MALVFRRKSPGLRIVPVGQLNPGQNVVVTLFHETGTPVLTQGQSIGAEHLRALAASKIAELYECKTEDDLMMLIQATPKCPCPVKSLPVGTPIPYNIYDRGNRFLLRKGGILALVQHQAMAQQMENVYINEASQIQTLNRYDLELVKTRADGVEAEFKTPEALTVNLGESILPQLIARQPNAPRPMEQVRNARRKFDTQIKQTAELLFSLQQDKPIDLGPVSSVVDTLCEDLQKDLALTVGLGSEGGEAIGFQQHSTKVATLAMGVGLAMGIPPDRLAELGVAALLHEVGMFGVSPGLLQKKGGLNADEREQLNGHPILALKYLENVRGVSRRAALTVYQEHECPDRSGYPNHRPHYLIHDFAKIISICDAYEAMTSPRPFRESLLPYRAVEQLIFATTKLRYDQRVMRALLQLVGLFPVGSWVKLSNNCFARVVGNNHQKFDRPLVNMLFDESEQPLPTPKVVNLLETAALQITDVVDGSRFSGIAQTGF